MDKKQLLVKAAAAALTAATLAAPALAAKSKAKSDKNVPCYGVNKCTALGKCSGPGHECAGKNTCKGQGWLPMPKDSCLAIEGGSLTAKAAAPAEKK